MRDTDLYSRILGLAVRVISRGRCIWLGMRFLGLVGTLFMIVSSRFSGKPASMLLPRSCAPPVAASFAAQIARIEAGRREPVSGSATRKRRSRRGSRLPVFVPGYALLAKRQRVQYRLGKGTPHSGSAQRPARPVRTHDCDRNRSSPATRKRAPHCAATPVDCATLLTGC